MLCSIAIPSEIDRWPLEAGLEERIASAMGRIEAFQDRWDRPQLEQFVAADFRHVCQALQWIRATQFIIGNRFLEWGAGFAVVAAIASHLGFDAVGIESEADLIREGKKTARGWDVNVELIHGNFLPRNAESMSHDPSFPSLGHPVDSAYDTLGMDLEDFAIVYGYPWPGEDVFHSAVFDRYAAPGALMLLFCGPNDLRLVRKQSGRSR